MWLSNNQSIVFFHDVNACLCSTKRLWGLANWPQGLLANKGNTSIMKLLFKKSKMKNTQRKTQDIQETEYKSSTNIQTAANSATTYNQSMTKTKILHSSNEANVYILPGSNKKYVWKRSCLYNFVKVWYCLLDKSFKIHVGQISATLLPKSTSVHILVTSQCWYVAAYAKHRFLELWDIKEFLEVLKIPWSENFEFWNPAVCSKPTVIKWNKLKVVASECSNFFVLRPHFIKRFFMQPFDG